MKADEMVGDPTTSSLPAETDEDDDPPEPRYNTAVTCGLRSTDHTPNARPATHTTSASTSAITRTRSTLPVPPILTTSLPSMRYGIPAPVPAPLEEADEERAPHQDLSAFGLPLPFGAGTTGYAPCGASPDA